jgi:hypothetical protein
MPPDPTAWLKSEDRRLDERPVFEGLCQRSHAHTIEQISTRHECHVMTEAESLHSDLLVVVRGLAQQQVGRCYFFCAGDQEAEPSFHGLRVRFR